MRKSRSVVINTLPRELARTAPRPVRLNSSGWAVLIGAVLLLAGGVIGGGWLFVVAEASRQESAGLTDRGMLAQATVAEVRRTRGKDSRTRLTYIYTAGGEQRQGTVQLRKSDPLARTATEGMRVPVRYLPSDPNESWMRGYSPEAIPFWVVLAAPVLPVAAGVGLLLYLRRELALLENGRAVLARVVSVHRLRGRSQPTQRVEIEWELLSGRKARQRFDVSSVGTLQPGSRLPVVYDAENPKQFARYPMAVTRLDHT